MENASEKYIAGAAAMCEKAPRVPNNTPTEYKDRHHQFYARRTREFAARRAKIASDYVHAKVQGLFPGDFYKWREIDLRLSDITPVTVSATRKSDDYKQAFFTDPTVGYIPPGALIETMGNKWLVTNPNNISAALPSALVRRCNAVINSYDHYGNIISEPVSVTNELMRQSENTVERPNVLPEGNFEVICQLNDNTRNYLQNRRVLLGHQAFYLTGINDFFREFTDKKDSSHLLTFLARLEEITDKDDLDTLIAGGRTHNFRILLAPPDEIREGREFHIDARLYDANNEIEDSEEYPIDFIFESSDPLVVSVGKNNTLFALAEGEVEIRVKIAQNPSLSASALIKVSDGVIAPYVAFTSPAPEYLRQNLSYAFNAAYFLDGEITAEPVDWSFSGADPRSYAIKLDSDDMILDSSVIFEASEGLLIHDLPVEEREYKGSRLEIDGGGRLIQVISADINNPAKLTLIDQRLLRATADGLTVICLSPSDTPLVITASAFGVSASVSVRLAGY